MEQLHNGFTLELCDGAFPLSTDSMLLADFVRTFHRAVILDLGSGCGTLGLLLCAKEPSCFVSGIELDECAHKAALHNIEKNGLTGRMNSVCADIRKLPQRIKPGSFPIVISNPPYFTAGPASFCAPLARREDMCSLQELFTAAAWAVKFGGDFYLVHRAERLAQICSCAAEVGLEAKRIRLVRHKPDAPFSLVLVQCRKGANPGVILDELCLHNADGSQSDDYRRIYHL